MPAMPEPPTHREPATDDPPAAAPPVRTRRNWDAYAAIIATLIGFLALLVSGYTAHVQREQLRAQVWPYLTVSSGNVAPDIGWHVTNGGTGPARVVAVRVTVDGQPVKTWAAAQIALGGQPGGIVQSTLSHTVLPAGKELTMIRPFNDDKNAAFIALLLSSKHELTIDVCYCSVLDECWRLDENVPQPIGGPDDCPFPEAEQFKQ
jgi:hypothetical protein